MNETLKALDQLFSKLITNLLSTKVWITLGGMAASTFIAYQVGGQEAALAAIASSLGLGGVYTAAKTYQNTHGANATVTNGTSLAPAATPGVSPPFTPETADTSTAAPGSTDQQVKYWPTPDLDAAYKEQQVGFTETNGEVNWFKVANEVQSWYEQRQLTSYHPDVRIPLALKLSDIAIDARRHVFETVCKVKPPADYTLVGTESQNKVEKLVKDATPGCEALSEGQKLEIYNLGKLYDERRNIETLVGKSIKWSQGYDTAQLLGHFGIMAIG